MTNQFDLTDEQRQIQEMAQQFTADALTPFAGEWDEKHIFPRDTIRAAASSASARSTCRRRAAGSA
jgi:alkylation response protein AidB-like acyl-CoA dehydrogenase